MALDLNTLREVIQANQANQRTLPTEPSQQVVVDKEGRVMLGNQAGDTQQTTQVPQEIFAR